MKVYWPSNILSIDALLGNLALRPAELVLILGFFSLGGN